MMTDKVSYKEIYQAIKHKMEFGQVSRKDLVKRIIRKIILYFSVFSLFSMHFGSLHEFLENLNGK
jgi:hypothetical protein